MPSVRLRQKWQSNQSFLPAYIWFLEFAKTDNGEFGIWLLVGDGRDDVGQVRLDIADSSTHTKGDVHKEHHVWLWKNLWSRDEFINVE